jgi:tetratricopeptide (TPR) repeat protein
VKSDKPTSSRRAPTAQQLRSRQRLGLILALIVVATSAAVWAVITQRRSQASLPARPLADAAPLASTNRAGTNRTVTPTPPNATNAAAVAGNASELDPAMRLQNAANELLAAGKIADAVRLYEQAAKDSPDDEEIHFSLGYAYAKAGRIPDAIRSYERALEVFPDHAEAHNNVGNLLVGLGKFDDAIAHFTAILKMNPESANALNNLGRCLAQQGKTKEAIAQFSEAVRLKPSYVEARCNLAAALLQQGRTLEASAQYTEALRISPGFPPALAGKKRLQGAKP